MENSLPIGWISTSLEEITSFIIGGDWGIDGSEKGFEKTHVIRGTDYKHWNAIRASKSAIRYVKSSSIEKRELREGDMVLEVSGGGPDQPVGRVIIVDRRALDSVQGKLCFSNFFRLIRIAEPLNSFYVKYYLDYAYSNGDFNEMQTHTTNLRNLRVNEFLSKTSVPLPPLPEQQRIVAKLDEIMEKIDRSRARLERVPQILKRFRQSILSAAVTGKLTEEWRERNDIINKIELLDDYEINEDYKSLPELPTTWKWVALGNYVKCNRGRFSIRPRNDPKYFNGNIPFIQIGDLPREGGEVVNHSQTLNNEGLKVSKMFPKGTVAIAIVGATIGNTGILGYDMCFTDSMVGIDTGSLNQNLFIDFYLRSEKENMRQLSYAGGGQPNIKLELLNAYPFPLPPIEEQTQIVGQVEKLFALVDKIEARYNKAKAQLDKLPQALLAKAFRGELVPQDESDEPASVLLERIKHDKGIHKKTQKYTNEEKQFSLAAEP